jgi:hypothetical protein
VAKTYTFQITSNWVVESCDLGEVADVSTVHVACLGSNTKTACTTSRSATLATTARCDSSRTESTLPVCTCATGARFMTQYCSPCSEHVLNDGIRTRLSYQSFAFFFVGGGPQICTKSVGDFHIIQPFVYWLLDSLVIWQHFFMYIRYIAGRGKFTFHRSRLW